MFLESEVLLVRRADNLTAISWADCLDNVGTLISHNPIGFHGLLRGQLYFTLYNFVPTCILSGRCGIGDLSQLYRPPWPAMGRALFFCVEFIVCNVSFIVRVALCAVSYLSVMPYFVWYVYLYVMSYSSTTAKGKNPFAIQIKKVASEIPTNSKSEFTTRRHWRTSGKSVRNIAFRGVDRTPRYLRSECIEPQIETWWRISVARISYLVSTCVVRMIVT
jgi:hypothetical protein